MSELFQLVIGGGFIFCFYIFPTKYLDRTTNYKTIEDLGIEPTEVYNRDLIIGTFYNNRLEPNKEMFIHSYFHQGAIINYRQNNYIVVTRTIKSRLFKFYSVDIYLEPYLDTNTDAPHIEYNNYYKDSPFFYVNGNNTHNTFNRGDDINIDFIEIQNLENKIQSFINANDLTADEKELLEQFKGNLYQQQATKEEAESILDILTKYGPLATSLIDLIKSIFF